MGRQSFFHQRFIRRRKRRLVQFQCATDKQLPLADRQTGQFIENFRKAHAAILTRRHLTFNRVKGLWPHAVFHSQLARSADFDSSMVLAEMSLTAGLPNLSFAVQSYVGIGFNYVCEVGGRNLRWAIATSKSLMRTQAPWRTRCSNVCSAFASNQA